MRHARSFFLFVLLPSLAFSLAACGVDDASSDDASETQAESLVSAITIGAVAGATTTKNIAVSGAERLSTPETYNWSCGQSNAGWYSSPSNVAWVELKNPSTKTASVSVVVSGPSSANELFAYGSKNARLSDCRSHGRDKLTGGSSVVIAPGDSAWVLVDVGTSTGVFALTVTTDRTATVKSSVAVPSVGSTTDVDVALDGEARQSTPETYNWSCGRSNAGWYSSPSNVAWLQIENPFAEAASVSVELDGASASNAKMFAYASKTASSTDCLTFGPSGKLSGTRGLVLGAGQSAWVLVDGGTRTGVSTAHVKTERLTDAPAKIAVAPAEGSSVATSIVLDGRTRQSTPETYNWSCGRSNAGWYSSPSNVAWLEVENPTPSAASLSIAGTKRMFAYASKSAALTDCIAFTTTGALSGSKSVVVEPNASAWILFDGDDDTGITDVEVTTEALIDP